MDIDARKMWQDCAEALRVEVSDAVWQSTFSRVQALDLDRSVLRLGVPNTLVKERFDGRFHSLVTDALTTAGWPDIVVTVDVVASTMPDAADDEPIVDPRSVGARQEATESDVEDHRPQANGAPDGFKYTFESFVIGASNRFAHAAALSVAERPGTSYNPLFIYGGAGLGKTHLLQAIANYVRATYPSYTIRYVSTETFLNEFVDSIRNSTSAAFKRRYRGQDLLLVDDIQFMEG